MNTPTDALRALEQEMREYLALLKPMDIRAPLITQWADRITALLRQPSPPSDSALRVAQAELIVWAAQRYNADVRKIIIESVEWVNARVAEIERG